MLVRGIAGLVASALLLLSTTPADAQDGQVCGYTSSPREVASERRGVPLLYHPRSLPDEERERMLAHRHQLLRREREHRERCPRTEAYLNRILARLLSGSQLQAFAEAEPTLTLVFQCGSHVPLPVARASAGKVVLVPQALPQLAASEDAIAAVLAHELAHLTLRHAERFLDAAKVTQASASERARLKRDHEREADITGLMILSNAGYDPQAAVDHLRAVDDLAKGRTAARAKQARPSVHDDAQIRTAQLEAQIRACGYPKAEPRSAVASWARGEKALLADARDVDTARRKGMTAQDQAQEGYVQGFNTADPHTPGVSRTRHWSASGPALSEPGSAQCLLHTSPIAAGAPPGSP